MWVRRTTAFILAENEASLLPSGPFVLGGDFNSSRSIAKWHEQYLTGLSELGCFDCHWRIHGRDVQSFWGHQAKAAYQDDHIFTSNALGTFVRHCKVIDTPETRRLSDHGAAVVLGYLAHGEPVATILRDFHP